MVLRYAYSGSAPRFTAADEEREVAELTSIEKDEINADLMGLIPDGISLDMDDISSELLDEFKEAMDKISLSEKIAYTMAQQQCPLVVSTESDPARFLRSVKYNPESAAKRMAVYWEKRLEFFGEEHAFEPMSLSGALARDVVDILDIQEFANILPPDKQGRTVVCLDMEFLAKEVDRMVIVRYFWYVMHVALESKSTQTKGAVLIAIYKRSLLENFDRIRFKKITNTMREWLPLSLKGTHSILSSGAYKAIGPMAKAILGRDMRRRTVFHDVSKLGKLLEDMAKYGIKREGLPVSIGGSYSDATDKWVSRRLCAENEVNLAVPSEFAGDTMI